MFLTTRVLLLCFVFPQLEIENCTIFFWHNRYISDCNQIEKVWRWQLCYHWSESNPFAFHAFVYFIMLKVFHSLEFYEISCIMQTFVSKELNHSGIPQPTPKSIWRVLLIGLLVFSCSSDFHAGKFPVELLVAFLDKSRSVKRRAPANFRCEGHPAKVLNSEFYLCPLSKPHLQNFKLFDWFTRFSYTHIGMILPKVADLSNQK